MGNLLGREVLLEPPNSLLLRIVARLLLLLILHVPADRPAMLDILVHDDLDGDVLALEHLLRLGPARRVVVMVVLRDREAHRLGDALELAGVCDARRVRGVHGVPEAVRHERIAAAPAETGEAKLSFGIRLAEGAGERSETRDLLGPVVDEEGDKDEEREGPREGALEERAFCVDGVYCGKRPSGNLATWYDIVLS